ncbi:MAG: cupredoxin domain-containing protein [Thermodesulfobacteriota bacterium]
MALILVMVAVVGTLLVIIASEKYRLGKEFTVELLARSPEHGNWYPREISIPYGQEVKILLRNIETVSHGFAIPDFNIAVKEIKAGEVKVVKFKAEKKGVFPFLCTVWCSEAHLQMKGKIVVHKPSR